jgi:hypothetical protein
MPFKCALRQMGLRNAEKKSTMPEELSTIESE